MDDAIQRLLESAFPRKTFVNLIRAVQEGIFLSDDTIAGSPMLNTKVALDLKGHIRRAGVMFRIQQFCEADELPFEAEMKRMPRGSWHWLELKSGNVRGHVVRTDEEGVFPEDTPNRQDQRLSNQLDLFADQRVIPLADLVPTIPRVYTWLMYRAARDGNLAHLCLGVPAHDTDDWLGYINVLKEAAIEAIDRVEHIAPRIDPREAMRFRQDIEEAIEKDDADQRDESED